MIFFIAVCALLEPLTKTSGEKKRKKHSKGVRTAPQRAREVVIRAQQNAAAARLARGLAAEREAKVDVQASFFSFFKFFEVFFSFPVLLALFSTRTGK